MYYNHGYHPYCRYPYCGYPPVFGFYPTPYYPVGAFNSQIASVNQSFFNAGVATGVYQTANNYNYMGFGR